MADPDAPAQKRPRLDSGNPVQYNGHGHAFAPPPIPSHAQPSRSSSHPTLAQTSSPPPPSRHYAPHSLPPPAQPFTPRTQGSFPGALASPSHGPSDIRAFADPRSIPSPGQHPAHGVAPVPVTVPQDRISTYRPQQPPTPQSAPVQDLQSSRSSSFSSEVKPPLSSGPMESSHPYWSSHPDQRNGSNGVSNGYNHTVSPPHSAGPQSYQQPPPPGQPYGQPAPPTQYAQQPSYAPSPYMGNYAASDAQVRRKQVRATQACNHCRSRKQKCDEARPCQFCRENNFDCQYKDVPPPKQDRSMMQLQDSVNNMSEVLNKFIGEMSSWRQDVESRLASGGNTGTNGAHPSPEAPFQAPWRDQSRLPTPTQPRNQPQRLNSMKMESPMAPPQHMSPNGAHALTPIKQESSFSSQQTRLPAEDARSYSNGSSRPVDYVPKEKSGLQSDHTTPAHKLLEEWHTMKYFYKDVVYLNKLVENGQRVSAYPMQLELDRGLLRVWGVGEGQDLHDGAPAPSSPNSSNESDVPSPSPAAEGLWGYPPMDHASPSTMSVSTPQDVAGNEGGLGSDGRPIFHSATVCNLLESYMKYMHVLHPFMNAGKLKRMVRDFIDQYSPDIKPSTARSPANGVVQHQFTQGTKRKRSGSNGYASRGTIERSLRNAIVLLVLALGKVFQFEAKTLPNPEKDRHVGGTWGPVPGNVSHSFTSDASEDTRQRNIDKLPGMAYFAYATDILGNQNGGNTIAHAHAMILAALYLSQFARVLESWSWINNACRVTLVLIKADMTRLNREWYMKHREGLPAKEQYRLNQVMLVYWTCLQLESDILAEMSTLPPSGISAYQGDIMYPNGVSETFPSEEGSGFLDERQDNVRKGEEDDKSMMIYSSQIWLRVILNEAHNALYGSGGQGSIDTTNIRDVAKVANIHLEILESWRRMLPAQLKWEDDEDPAIDLNVARLRAKYYGGLYMMLRPYLRIASHNIGLPPEAARSSSQGYSHRTASPAGYSSGRNVQVVDLSQGQQDIINIACQGIDSAIRSTVAFDRVGAEPGSAYIGYRSTRTKRLVVTNIFGTLHAQFGNMLVLTSVFASKLHPLLPKDTKLTKSTLAALLERTITILGEVEPNSPILAMDLEILKGVREKHKHLLV